MPRHRAAFSVNRRSGPQGVRSEGGEGFSRAPEDIRPSLPLGENAPIPSFPPGPPLRPIRGFDVYS